MINDVRNFTGFTNFATAKKLKARAPYSSKFQPLKAEVEAVRNADMIEPYSVEQSLHAFDEEHMQQDAHELENLADAKKSDAQLDEFPSSNEPSGQTKLYSNSSTLAHKEALENEPGVDDQLDDKTIIDTVVTNLSDKIDTSFNALELDVAKAIEMRLGRALLGAFKQQLSDETSERLKHSIAGIIKERGAAKVNISGPSELIELFKAHSSDEDGDETKLSFSIDEASTDLIVQIDEISITSRFDELDSLVSELFE